MTTVRAMAADPQTRPVNPRDAVAGFIHAWNAGDEKAMRPFMTAMAAEDPAIMPPLEFACGGLSKFNTAMKQKFGDSVAGKWGVAPASIKIASVRENGDAATVELDGAKPATGIGVVRRGGVWSLTFDGLRNLLRQRGVDQWLPTDEAYRRLGSMGGALGTVAEGVLKGDYPTADAAAEAGKKAWNDAANGVGYN